VGQVGDEEDVWWKQMAVSCERFGLVLMFGIFPTH